MCFSATASFIASAVLFAIGIMAMNANKRKEYLWFSTIPLFFAVQQFAEGLVWVSLQSTGYTYMLPIAMYSYLIFAVLVWPVLIPFSLIKVEKHASRLNVLKVLLLIGVVWSISAALMILLGTATATIAAGHIQYSLSSIIDLKTWYRAIYVIATVLPFFATHMRPLWAFGSIMFAAGIASYFFWSAFFISIWCFFAALVSVFVYLIIRSRNMHDRI